MSRYHTPLLPLTRLPYVGLLALAAALPLLGLGSCGGSEPSSSGQASASSGLEEGLVVLNPSETRPYFHSFGTVPFGEEVRHTFELQSRESKTVEIFNVQGGCSCTRLVSVDLVDEQGNILQKGNPRSPNLVLEVPPMGLVNFTVSMDTKKLKTPNAEKLEIVRMRTSSTLTTFPTFELHLATLQPFQITPPLLNLGEIPINGGKHGVVRIVTKDYGGDARIIGVHEVGDGLEVDLQETFTSGEHLWSFDVRADALQPLGAFKSSFTVAATDPLGEGDTGRHVIEVWGQVVPDVVPAPRTFGFRPLREGEEYVLRGSLKALIPGAHIKILGHQVASDVAQSIRVEYEPKAPNASGASTEWTLHMTALPDLPAGRFTGRVLLELDDPQNPLVEVPFSGTVQGN